MMIAKIIWEIQQFFKPFPSQLSLAYKIKTAFYEWWFRISRNTILQKNFSFPTEFNRIEFHDKYGELYLKIDLNSDAFLDFARAMQQAGATLEEIDKNFKKFQENIKEEHDGREDSGIPNHLNSDYFRRASSLSPRGSDEYDGEGSAKLSDNCECDDEDFFYFGGW